MQAYGIDCKINGHVYTELVDAKNKESAKKKIARKHKVEAKDVSIVSVRVIGYF